MLRHHGQSNNIIESRSAFFEGYFLSQFYFVTTLTFFLCAFIRTNRLQMKLWTKRVGSALEI